MLLTLGIALLTAFYFLLRNYRKAKLSIYLTDHYMKINEPIPICGTPDVIWIDQAGVLIVGDYKSRQSCKVQQSDIIQLSVYRVLLEHTQRRSVSNEGFVHFKNGRWIRVKLLDERAIIALYQKYQNILDGKGNARCTHNSNYCQYCSHLDIC